MIDREITIDSGGSAVCIDAMNTIFVGRGSRSEMNATVMREELARVGVTVDVDPVALARWTDEERSALRREGMPKDHPDYWRRVNSPLVRRYAPGLDDATVLAVADAVHDRVLTDPSLYAISDGWPEAFARLRERGLTLFITSNQTFANVWRFVRHFGLEGDFPAQRIFTSDIVGVPKRDPAYWLRVQELVNMTAGWEVLLETAETYLRWSRSGYHRASLAFLGLLDDGVARACAYLVSDEGRKEWSANRFDHVREMFPDGCGEPAGEDDRP